MQLPDREVDVHRLVGRQELQSSLAGGDGFGDAADLVLYAGEIVPCGGVAGIDLGPALQVALRSEEVSGDQGVVASHDGELHSLADVAAEVIRLLDGG